MNNDYRFPTEQYLLIGKVSKAHGLNGEVKIVSFSGQPEKLIEYREIVFVERNGRLSRPLSLHACRAQGNAAIVNVESVTNRSEAENLEGVGVLVARDRLPQLEDGEYYWHQYQGRRVLDLEGRYIGTVSALFSGGAQDILVIDNAGEEILVPVVKEIVVRETADSLIINPPPGLLEMNSGDDPI